MLVQTVLHNKIVHSQNTKAGMSGAILKYNYGLLQLASFFFFIDAIISMSYDNTKWIPKIITMIISSQDNSTGSWQMIIIKSSPNILIGHHDNANHIYPVLLNVILYLNLGLSRDWLRGDGTTLSFYIPKDIYMKHNTIVSILKKKRELSYLQQ